MWQSLPLFGKLVLDAVMIAAAYTFSVAIVSARGRPRFLQAARLGAYGTVSLIGLAILCLLYAFVTHDFRIKYVAQHSDRSMPVGYLFTSLWGGQDGSLLWWLFLLSIYTAVCVRWLKGRFRELQPYIRRRAIRHLEKGRLVIFAAGTGNPYFSTDTAAALRAMEIHASALFKATKVEGIYDRDPARHGDAKMFTHLTYERFLVDRIGVMDSTAVTLCRDNKMPIRVFKLTERGNIRRVCMGEDLGTVVDS